jgi:S1-C subfamily serine protease
MRHAALAAALLAALAAPALASDPDAGFAAALGSIRDAVYRPDNNGGRAVFVPADWVQPQRRRTLERLDREMADLYERSLPATFIIRTGVRGQRGSGTGSGFFIHPDGTGMTNVHVVGNEVGKEVEIETVRGVKKAKVLAVAPGRDIAIIKVSNDNFADWSALVMGGQLRAGNNVFAIGNPADQGSTFTRGIVSRPSQDQFGPWIDVLQLDIELNPGNSGGALVDSQGRLAGMNQAILRGGAINGIGFAIPVQELAKARDEFASTGKLEDGVTQLGVIGDELTVVSARGASGQAGFRPGDAITSFPGSDAAVPGRRANALYRAVGRSRPGQTVAVQVSRAVPCKVHTSAAAGGAPVASVDAHFNPVTGVVMVPGSPAFAGFLAAVTETSAEELEYNGQRYPVAAQGNPAPYGMIFNVPTFAKKVLPTETLQLPVEVYSPAATAASAAPENPLEGLIPGLRGN